MISSIVEQRGGANRLSMGGYNARKAISSFRRFLGSRDLDPSWHHSSGILGRSVESSRTAGLNFGPAYDDRIVPV